MNPMRGEAALGEHKLIVDFNGFCSLEAATGMKVPDLVVMFKTGIGFGFGELRQFIQIFLDKPLSEKEVGDLIGELGMIEVPVPVELRKKGEPETAQMWLAAHALGQAMDGFLAPKTEQKENPRKAA